MGRANDVLGHEDAGARRIDVLRVNIADAITLGNVAQPLSDDKGTRLASGAALVGERAVDAVEVGAHGNRATRAALQTIEERGSIRLRSIDE